MTEPLDLEPIKVRLDHTYDEDAWRGTPWTAIADVEALIAEVERMRVDLRGETMWDPEKLHPGFFGP